MIIRCHCTITYSTGCLYKLNKSAQQVIVYIDLHYDLEFVLNKYLEQFFSSVM